MNNLNSETEAKALLESIAPDKSVRRRYLTILANAIIEVNRLDRRQWAVTTFMDVPRLVVGHYYTYTPYDNGEGVWLALDTNSLNKFIQQGVPESFQQAWKPDAPEGYPHYKDRSGIHSPFSTNGCYDFRMADSKLWPKVERLSFQFISTAIDMGQRMRSDSKARHASGILKYMRKELDRSIPDLKP
jgi:hypothetical protein